jgi:hypothetical protein
MRRGRTGCQGCLLRFAEYSYTARVRSMTVERQVADRAVTLKFWKAASVQSNMTVLLP